MHRNVWTSALTAMLLIGCADKPANNPLLDAPRPISEQRELQAAPSKKLKHYEDCKSFGGPGCESGICLQAGPNKFHCTRACAADTDCGGANFECAQVYPAASEGGWFCVNRHPDKASRPRDGGAP